jgi:hypothetical protein
MKVRTISELQNKLDIEISWRKKELVDYKFIVENNKNSTQLVPLVRGGIALGYAHWEGFIKMASSIFVSYISIKKVPFAKIQTNFIALSYLRRLNKGKNIQECITLIDEILFETSKPCKILDKDVIDTKSNLKFYVLKDILNSLGLEESFFNGKENFLDKKLVEPRNDIAHGTYRDVSYEDYKIVYDNIIPLMEHYKTLIENSVVLSKYRR